MHFFLPLTHVVYYWQKQITVGVVLNSDALCIPTLCKSRTQSLNSMHVQLSRRKYHILYFESKKKTKNIKMM